MHFILQINGRIQICLHINTWIFGGGGGGDKKCIYRVGFSFSFTFIYIFFVLFIKPVPRPLEPLPSSTAFSISHFPGFLIAATHQSTLSPVKRMLQSSVCSAAME